ncbi:MAG: sulfatase-like hydrolase/transferase, partial [Pirellulales bacterium]
MMPSRNSAVPISLAAVFLIGLLSAVDPASAAPQRPNILWISCEDIGPHLGCYGDAQAVTPTIDRLAQQGVRYTHAFTTCPVCATNRSSIITGMFPTTIGTHYMRCRARLPETIRCFTETLRKAGYYCTNNAKTDYNFSQPATAWDASSRQAGWQGRQPDQPFFAVYNFTNTHESKIWPRGESHRQQIPDVTSAQRRDPAWVVLPPYYPDTPETRRDWANYMENITQLDYYVADLLDRLKQDGLADSTIVFFWSDHGAGLPRAKRWLYDSGTHIPLIVRIPPAWRLPGQGHSGTVNDELVLSLDFGPTVLNLAGLPVPPHMQGRPFLGKDRPSPREFVVGVRDRMDERYDIVRTVRDHRYRYIHNYMPYEPYMQYLNYAERNATMKALRSAKADGSLPEAARLLMADRKPVEELYDTLNDPHEIHNLAASSDERHHEALHRLRGVLDQWSRETHDLGLVPESMVIASERQHGHRMALLDDPAAELWMEVVRRLMAVDAGEDERHRRCAAGLGSPYPVVRYWAVTGLVRGLGDPPPRATKDDRKRVGQFATLLEDESPIVRIAAADALCRLGDLQRGLPVLIRGLESTVQRIPLAAAIALDELDL